ncbi:MAG: hypothetical protein R3F56_21095 [Planctomycetota bacterium]
MDRLRDEVRAVLTKGPDATFEERLQRAEAFVESGVWPEGVDPSLWDRFVRLRGDLDKAYQTAGNSLMQEDLKLARSILEQMRRWQSVNDLNGWTAVATTAAASERAEGDVDTVDRPVVAERGVARLAVELPAAYRLEVRGRLAEKRPVTLLVPFARRMVRLELQVDDNGWFHAFVAVILDPNGDPVLDLQAGFKGRGTEQGSDSDDAVPLLEAAGASLQTVRWKRVCPGEVEAPVNVADESSVRKDPAAEASAQNDKAERRQVAAEIKRLEKKRGDALGAIATWSKLIEANERRIKTKEEQIASLKRRHRRPDPSDLEADKKRYLSENRGLRAHIAAKRKEIAALDGQLSALRERL